MKPIFLNQDENGSGFLYLQLYTAIKKEILSGEMQADEKLPSLRSLASDLGISITTVELRISQKPHPGRIQLRQNLFLPKLVFHLEKPQQRLHYQKLLVREMSAPTVRIPHLLQIHRLYTI